MKKKLILFILVILSLPAFSQLSNKHWIPPLHANEDQDSNLVKEHYVYLSTPEANPFPVYITDGSGMAIPGSPFVISQNNPAQIYIGFGQPSVMFLDKSDVGSVKPNKGLILEGQYDFYVSFRVRADNHAEFLSSKGTTGAGTTFRLGSLPQNDYGTIRNFVSSFMATEDNTTVNLSEYQPTVQFIIGNTISSPVNQTFTLNRGESVVISGYTNVLGNLDGFLGALLTSNKPIVVNTGNMAGGMNTATAGQDFNLDQIVPLEQVGTEYIIMKGNGSNNSEFPLIIAHENNTEIFVNGNPTPITTLNAGQFFLIPTSNFLGSGNNFNMYIESSKPIFLYQIVAGSQSDATTGFYFIPPLSCFWQRSVDLIPDINKIAPSDSFSGNVIIATELGSTVTINDIITTAVPQVVTGKPNWVTYKITGLSGNVKVESTGAIAVGVLGASGSAGFGGYFSGFGSIPRNSETTICSNSIINLFERIPGNPEPGGVWTVPVGAPLLDGNFFDPGVNIPGIYTYTFSKTCDGITRVYPIDINVLPIVVGPNVGTSTTAQFCSTDSIIDLTILLGTGITPGGSWTFNGVARANGIFDPSTDIPGNYTYTISSNGTCETVSATIVVSSSPSPSLMTITDLEVCDDNAPSDTDGESLFILTNKTAEIIGSQTNVSVKYYVNQNDAINNNTNNITSIRATNNTIIYFRLTNQFNCFVVGSFILIVNPLPTVNTVVTLKQCDIDTDGITDFNLEEANQIITSTPELFTFSFHLSEFGAINNTALILNTDQYTAANGSTVWARIENENGCFRTARVNLIVSTTSLNSSNNFTIVECDDFIDENNSLNDGFDFFDLTPASNYFLSLFPSNQNLILNFYENANDALSESNPITNLLSYRNTVSNIQKIWVRIDSTINNECIGLGDFLTLIVNPLPDTNLGDDFVLCVNPNTGHGSQIIDATPSFSGNYSYVWNPINPNGNSPIYEVTQDGVYSVIVTNITTGCENTDAVTVTFSSEPAIFSAEVTTPAFSLGSTTIVAMASGGFGEYEYSLNLVDWQSSNIFTDLPNGSYVVYVRDIQGCGLLNSGTLFALTYPNFFTPNGDGYHDTWNIANLNPSYEAKIFIYDRYGKLIRQVNPNGEGWDGTFAGQQLPATDYWFRIEYKENGTAKEFKSHFSLIR